ncbi:hypothetical protein [Paenibacillus sp. FSL W8-0194]
MKVSIDISINITTGAALPGCPEQEVRPDAAWLIADSVQLRKRVKVNK